jgi:hypothetical protein
LINIAISLSSSATGLDAFCLAMLEEAGWVGGTAAVCTLDGASLAAEFASAGETVGRFTAGGFAAGSFTAD